MVPRFLIALSPNGLRAFFVEVIGTVIIQTSIDQKAMTALAKMTRKTIRRGRNGPVRSVAWVVVFLEAFLTYICIRGGLSGWHINALLGLIMLACIFGEDYVNGAVGLRRTPPESRVVNTAFQDESCYITRSQAGERWWLYSQIQAVVETKDYFALLLDRKHGQVFDKKGFAWGDPEEFRALIRKKTGLKIQKIW